MVCSAFCIESFMLTHSQLTQIEHILKRPDSYIGSIETVTQATWTYDSSTKRVVHRDVKYVPGFFKIIDEILVNAADNKVKLIARSSDYTNLLSDQRSLHGHSQSQHRYRDLYYLCLQ
jgi:hypothetical protein